VGGCETQLLLRRKKKAPVGRQEKIGRQEGRKAGRQEGKQEGRKAGRQEGRQE